MKSATKIYEGQLCVDDLMPPASLLTCNIYAIAGETDSFSASLLWHTLASTCASGHTACLITEADPGSLPDFGAAEEIQAALSARQLSIFEVNPTQHTGVARVRQMIADLQHWGMHRSRLLVVHGAETLFPDLDAALLKEWRDWAETHGNVVLLMFRQSEHEDAESLRALTECARMFAGMARFRSRYGATSLEIFHWFNEQGMVAGKSFPLRLGSDGRLKGFEVDSEATHTIEAAVDETQVLAMRSAFLPKESVPADWRIVDDNPDLLPELTTGAVAATVVLAFTTATDFDRIARCVFHLRKQCGARMKIIIREVNSRLRYSQETLAVRLGANLIVPAEISYARFLSLTSMVQGQVFPHSLPSTYERALKGAMPEYDQGYLPPSEFAQSVRSIVAQSRVLHVQNAMVRLPLAYGLVPLDALRYCNVKRAGDLCSSDANSVYVFLYACRESDVDKTLERLFALPVGELFSTEDRFLSSRTIEEALHDYEERRADGNYPDLSEELAGLAEVAPARRPEQPVAAVVSAQAGSPAAVRYKAPPPATRRPLSLRGVPVLTDVSLPQS